jgi:hypothetical protein
MSMYCPACGGELQHVRSGVKSCRQCERNIEYEDITPTETRRYPRRVMLSVLAILLVGGLVWFLGSAVAVGMREHSGIHCAGNLRAIGEALRKYAEAHDGRYPDDWSVIGTEVPDYFFQCELQEGPAYVYIGRELTLETATPQHILAYEPFARHKRASVLYGDGRIEGLRREALAAELNRVAEMRTAKPMP